MGYFGAGNFGDDALLADWLVRRKGWLEAKGISVDVITNGQDALGRFVEGPSLGGLVGSWIPKQQAMRVSPGDYAALIAPGGSLLQDVTSLKSLLYYLWMIRKFVSAGCRVFLLNQGIGPLNSWLASVLTPRSISRATMISLRDEQSFNWADSQRALSHHPGLVLSADPVLSSTFAPVEFRERLGIDGDYAAVIPKPTGDLPTPMDPTPEATALAELISHSMRTTGMPHYLLALHPGADLSFCEAVAKETENEAQVLPLDALPHSGSFCHAVIAGASLTISYRLHGLVTAAAHSGLAMGVAYDPKVVALCTELALPYCFPATVHEDGAKTDLARYWRDRDEATVITKSRVTVCNARHAAAEEKFDAMWD